LQPDSSKSISITIVDDPNLQRNSGGFTDAELRDFKKDIARDLLLQEMSPGEFIITRGFLNNFPAVFITFKTTQKIYDIQMEGQGYQVYFISDGKIYAIAAAMPSELYTTKEKKRIKNVINSFVFEKAFQ
jgi:hypothetical protein